MSHQPWSGVEHRHLVALAAVAEEGSFRAAADNLGYVQSAISDQIAQLEGSVGMRLIERRKGAGPGALTEAGELLLRHSKVISAQFAAAQAEVEALSDGVPRTLRIGAFESVARRLLPGALMRLQQLDPELAVEVVESRSEEELSGLVAAGRADAAFCCLPLPPAPLHCRELMRDRYVLLVPAAWPLARSGEPVSLSQLAAMQLIGLGDSGRTQLLDAQLRAVGVEPHYALRSSFDSAVQAMVGVGIGAAVMPRTAIDDNDGGTVVLELDGELTPRTIAVCWRSDREPVAGLERFLETAAECARQLGERRRRASAA